MIIRAESWAVGVSASRLQHHVSSRGDPYTTGAVTTPHGYVDVLAEDGYSRYDIILGGRNYCESHEHAGNRSDRSHAIRAGRFAERMAKAIRK